GGRALGAARAPGRRAARRRQLRPARARPRRRRAALPLRRRGAVRLPRGRRELRALAVAAGSPRGAEGEGDDRGPCGPRRLPAAELRRVPLASSKWSGRVISRVRHAATQRRLLLPALEQDLLAGSWPRSPVGAARV